MYVNYAAYRQGRRIGDIAIEQMGELLQDKDIFIWLALADPEAEELTRIQEVFNLHDLAIEDTRAAHQRPKLEEYGDTLFLVLHTMELRREGEPCPEGVTCGETHLFVGKQFLISIRHNSTVGYAKVRQRCENNPQLLARGPGFALYALLDFVVDQFLDIAGHDQLMLEQLEADIFENRLDSLLIERLYELKRHVGALRNVASPMLDMSNALMRLHPEIVGKDLRVYFRDVHDHVQRVLRATDMMREALSDAMQVNLALVSVHQNEVVKALAGWGAILAVPTMVFSMYGMNFKEMPELSWEYGYPTALGVTVIGCIWLYCRLKRAKWL